MQESFTLIHTAFGSWPMLEYELDMAQKEIDNGNNVLFLINKHDQILCECKLKRYCMESHSRTKNGISWVKSGPGKFKVLEYDLIDSKQEEELKNILYKLKNSDNLKNTLNKIDFLKKVDIYDSAVSTVATNEAISNPGEVDFKEQILKYIEIGIKSYYSVINHLKEHNIDKIFLYNGRMARFRPLLRIAQINNIDIKVYEYPLLGFMNYIMIDNQYPHDFNNISKELYKYFNSSNLPYRKKLSLGAEWFINRVDSSNQVKDILLPKFNERMKTKSMPKNWDRQNFNLVFFVSSEYEVADIKEVKSTHPYSQKNIVERINSRFPDINIHIRMHPNLEGVEKKFVKEMSNLDTLKNVNLISSKSSIDSYELMRMADLVLSFGSTVGIESAYLKKPVITVGASWYTEFGADINIQTDEELINSIQNAFKDDCSNFPSPEERNRHACEFAFAFKNFGEKPKYIDRHTFHGGYMVRNETKYEIKSDFKYILVNRLLDAPNKIISGLFLVISNRSKFKKIMQNPIKSLFDKLFNSHYH